MEAHRVGLPRGELTGLRARVTLAVMGDLHVSVGAAARTALCDAFDHARRSIDAEFYSIDDPDVLSSLNRAAERHVRVTLRIEADPERYDHKGLPPAADHCAARTIRRLKRLLDRRVRVIAQDDPLVLLHAKAAVVDGARGFVESSNPRRAAYRAAGAILVEDDRAQDVEALSEAMDGAPTPSQSRISAGVAGDLRRRIYALLDSRNDLRIAAEDLTDKAVVDRLIERRRGGHHDRVVVGMHRGASDKTSQAVRALAREGVSIRELSNGYMHAKFVDDGDSIYVGSANLTYTGLDEANEAGIVAPVQDFDRGGAATLRAAFRQLWGGAQAVKYSS